MTCSERVTDGAVAGQEAFHGRHGGADALEVSFLAHVAEYAANAERATPRLTGLPVDDAEALVDLCYAGYV